MEERDRDNGLGRDVRDDARAMALLSRHARTATAFQVLAPGMRHWFSAGDNSNNGNCEDDGMVAYAECGNAWVAAGEPIASRADTIDVAERFLEYAKVRRKRVTFFATEGALAASRKFRRVFIGEQPIWNPMEWPTVVTANRSLREQLRRARAKGVRVRALNAQDVQPGSNTRIALDRITQRWLATRPMSSMHFLVVLEPFQYVEQRRIFVAERFRGGNTDDAVKSENASASAEPSANANANENRNSIWTPVALLSLAPVAARNGWFLEHLLRDPSAPNGTSEALVDAAMRALAYDGVTWATLGLAPLSGPVSGWLRFVRDMSRPFYNFAGLAAFKRKLKPSSWEPIYMAYPTERGSIRAMIDGLRAFSGGSLVMFGVRTVLRGPQPLLLALELSLVPWTITLALWPKEPWFPRSSYKWAWVLFDVLLLGALYTLRRRWNDRLARAIAIVVTLDTVLTLGQTVLWNASRTRSTLEALMVAVACSAPALAAGVLWGAVRRRAVLSSANK